MHNLELQDLVAEISPRLIVGKNAYRTETTKIHGLITRIESIVMPSVIEAPARAGAR